MSFHHPALLLLLILPVLLAAWEWTRPGLRLTFPFDHGPSLPRRPLLRRLIDLAALLPAVLLAVGVVLLAGPRRAVSAAAEREMTNLQFCLDVSGSMTSPFGDGSRYDGAMAAIEQFTTFREGDAFGLTVFGNEVLHWVPLTRDTSAVRLSTPFLRPEYLPNYFGGTQIGKALRSCRDLMRRRPEGDRLVLLVTDGVSSDLGPAESQEVGAELADERITVYPIFIGAGGAPDDMHTLARATGGEVFEAGDPSALSAVFARIDQMRQAKMRPVRREFADAFAPVALVGLAAAGLHALALLGVRYTPW